jgi:hypothetical protein
MMEIDAAAFTMMELMELDSLSRMPPLDTFRRRRFGGFSWSGVCWGVLLCMVVALLFSPWFLVNIVLKAPWYGNRYGRLSLYHGR